MAQLNIFAKNNSTWYKGTERNWTYHGLSWCIYNRRSRRTKPALAKYFINDYDQLIWFDRPKKMYEPTYYIIFPTFSLNEWPVVYVAIRSGIFDVNRSIHPRLKEFAHTPSGSGTQQPSSFDFLVVFPDFELFLLLATSLMNWDSFVDRFFYIFKD